MRLLLLCFLFGLCAANIIVSEIMYNPRQGNDFQFVELYNTDSNSVDLSNWVFTSANTAFTFPSSTSIGGNAFVILAKDKNSFMFAYPDVPSNIVYGNIASIATGSGRINLKKSDGSVVLDYKYKDSWQPLSDGYGPSLELICYAVTDYTDANAWRASTLPTYGDILQEYSGSPNAHGTWYTCPPPVNSYPNINLKFSELMYHPNQEKSQVDNHEWLEIYNADSAALSLDGFRIVGKKGLMFSFPAGTVISANSYLVVAKNPSAFSAIYTSVPSSQVFGPYYGELANGGDSIAIADNNGRVIEEISYDNKWPWPLAADVQVNQPQYGGLSIERVSWSYSGNKAHNWVAATPTPGAANSAARAVPRPVVMTITVRQNGVDQGGNLAPSVNTNITFEINPKGSYENPTLEYFVDDIHTTGEQTNSVSLSEDSNGTYFYNFANGFAAKTILRFRVKADFDGSTGQVISHRSNDPVGWHGIYFSLQEVYDTNSTTYEIMITSSEWTAMWTNMRTDTNGHQYLDEESGKCCQPNPVWNADSVAVLAYRGKVYDVGVKYQGSNFNRMNGDNLDAFQSDENPTLPSPVIQLSWKIKLADYDSKIDGKEDIIIQKPKNLGCSYFTGYGLYKLARQLGLPAPKIKFSKLYVNGAYYLYGMDVDYYSSDMLQAFIEDHNRKNCRTQPTMQPGFAYKAMGYGCTQGYDGLADFQILKESTECGETIPADTRYANAYSLETEKSYGNTTRIQQLAFKIGKYNYDGQGNLISLDFTEPVKPEVKQYMQDNFDVNLVLNYLVLVNWAGAYDDLVGNYMLYVRQDGKMSMTAWDMDALMGANSPCEQASCSLFLGEQGAPVSQYNPPGGYNNLKDALIKTFREELKERYRVLAQTVLSVENVNKVFQEAQNEIDTSAMADPNVFPGVKLENMQSICYKNITTWHAQRNSYVKDTLGSPQSTTVNTCPDVAPLTQRFVTTYRAAPGTPDSPTLVKNSESSATVNWSAPNSNGYEITSYTLQKSVDDGDFNTVYSGSAQTYEDKEFSTKKLQYRVQATNSLGTSPYSAATTVVGGVITPVTTGTIGNSGALSTAGSENENSGSILCVSLLVYLLATFVAF